jgi:hypothetical protein
MSDSSPGGGNGRGDEHDGAQRHSEDWRKSSYSLSNGDCVEVACLAGSHIGVRDSKATEGPILRFAPDVWAAFLRGIRDAQAPS